MTAKFKIVCELEGVAVTADAAAIFENHLKAAAAEAYPDDDVYGTWVHGVRSNVGPAKDFFADVANIDGAFVGIFGKAERSIHFEISYNGNPVVATYAIHPALIPTVRKCLAAFAEVRHIGWLDADTGEWRSE